MLFFLQILNLLPVEHTQLLYDLDTVKRPVQNPAGKTWRTQATSKQSQNLRHVSKAGMYMYCPLFFYGTTYFLYKYMLVHCQAELPRESEVRSINILGSDWTPCFFLVFKNARFQ